MPETTIPKDALKHAIKEALLETLSEQQDVLRAVVADVLDDLAFGEAMHEGEATEVVSRERIFDLLGGGRLKVIFRKSFERDLKNLKGNTEVLTRLQQVIEHLETIEEFASIANVKPMQGWTATTASALATTA